MNNKNVLNQYNLYDNDIKNVVEEFRKEFLSLEDKVSQLFFLMMEASYDSYLLEEVELLLNVWSCGGVIFLGGNLSRQLFLTETFKKNSNNHLIVGNDLQHGLACLTKEIGEILNTHNLDWSLVGEKLFYYNLNHGILIQLSFNLGLDMEFFSSDEDRRLFLSGLKRNQQIAIAFCLDKIDYQQLNNLKMDSLQICSLEKLKQNLYHNERKRLSNYEEISFVNLSLISQNLTTSLFLQYFKSGAEAFLFSSKKEIDQGVKMICELIRTGKLSALLFDKILNKILTLKGFSKKLSLHSFI